MLILLSQEYLSNLAHNYHGLPSTWIEPGSEELSYGGGGDLHSALHTGFPLEECGGGAVRYKEIQSPQAKRARV